MTDTDTQRVVEIAAREQSASPGPWEVWEGCSWRRIGQVGRQSARPIIEPTNHHLDGHPDLTGPNLSADLRFIAHAREDVPYLLALITRQREEIERKDRIEKAAIALIADVRARYPGEDLRCPFMIELDAALEATK